VLGCLMEKQVTTPDQYPFSLNALVSATASNAQRTHSARPGCGGWARARMRSDWSGTTSAGRKRTRRCSRPTASAKAAHSEHDSRCAASATGGIGGSSPSSWADSASR